MSSHLQTLIQSLTNFKNAVLGRVRRIETNVSSLDSSISNVSQTLTEVHGWGDHGRAGYLTSVRWEDIDNYPTSYPPSTHNHTAADISNSTVIGRALITAASEAGGRDAIKAEKALGGPISISSNTNLATSHIGETLLLQNNATLTLPTAPAAWVGKYVTVWTPATGGSLAPGSGTTLNWHVGGEILSGTRAIAPGSTVTLFIETTTRYRLAGNGL